MARFIRIARQFGSGVLLLFLTCCFLILGLLPNTWVKRFLPNLYMRWSACFFGVFGVHEHLHFLNHDPLPERFILISNHPSGMELLWLPAHFRVVPLAKAEIRSWFIIGRIVQRIGAVFVDRKDRVSRQGAARALLDAVSAGKNVMIFPEGGCYGKDLNPFFNGAFHVSKQTGIPLLPVYLVYEEEDSYEWGDYGLLKFMFRALFIPRNRNAHLYIFDTVNPDRCGDVQEMRDQMHRFYLEQQAKYRIGRV